MLTAIQTHLDSGRSLDEDEQRARDRIEGSKTRVRPADQGPVYEWPEPYRELREAFEQVASWLEDYLAHKDSAEDADDARARIDAILIRLVVQRSRRRILSMLGSEADVAEAFRSPHVPRHPIAIGQSTADGARGGASRSFEER
ncbi:MAG: hypothetical protein WCJ30_27705, partial [Deltaproteobacteria bacterium]